MAAARHGAALPTDVRREAARRRAFAVISHPDAGKSTLTEAIALHANAISRAGAVHGKPGRRGVVSDWLEIERTRGISISSAVLQFAYRDKVINLVDTPGHADFSEDTYRALSAVDCVVMLLDAARGLEPQTLKLFDVCRDRGLPVITFINKWDRPGLDPLVLYDELVQRLNLRPTPLNWPVGRSGLFHGLLDCRDGTFVRYGRTVGGASAAPQERLDPRSAQVAAGEDWAQAQDDVRLLAESGHTFDRETFLSGQASPLFFGAAVLNHGVHELLDFLVDLAPAPAPRRDTGGNQRELDTSFSAFVFKVQTGMNPAHRDQIAFARVCSGVFERGMVVTNAATGRPFATKYVHQVFGQQRTTLDIAYPGDVIGLVNATALSVGDTLYSGKPGVVFPRLPSFAPAHFAVARPADLSRVKQFHRGIAQLQAEGVVQVLRSERRNRGGAVVVAAVGMMQFDVATYRMVSDYGAPIVLDHLEYSVVRRLTDPRRRHLIDSSRSEVLVRTDGTELAVFASSSDLAAVRRKHPDLELARLVAGVD
jgi:peptide chain release factor 3